MMVVLIVGADQLGNITQKLRQEGANEIIHWNGRNHVYRKKFLPKKVRKIVVFCDFINHQVMNNIKKQAKLTGIPVTYSKRALSWSVGSLLHGDIPGYGNCKSQTT